MYSYTVFYFMLLIILSLSCNYQVFLLFLDHLWIRLIRVVFIFIQQYYHPYYVLIFQLWKTVILLYQSLYHEVMFEFSSRVQVCFCTTDLFYFPYFRKKNVDCVVYIYMYPLSWCDSSCLLELFMVRFSTCSRQCIMIVTVHLLVCDARNFCIPSFVNSLYFIQ